MNTNINNRKLTSGVLFGAVAIFSVLSLGYPAEAAATLNCKADTASKVIKCCDKILQESGRPLWMVQSGSSCRKAAVCKGVLIGAAAVKTCYVQVVLLEDDKNANRASRNNRK
jgi:hypothetical protein